MSLHVQGIDAGSPLPLQFIKVSNEKLHLKMDKFGARPPVIGPTISKEVLCAKIRFPKFLGTIQRNVTIARASFKFFREI